MKKINVISSPEGRKLLGDLFRELKFDKNASGMRILITLWRICVNQKEIKRQSGEDVLIRHTLGIFQGTTLWMEEVINKYYFTRISSFVYFGAAVLLAIIGLRKFTDFVNNDIVIFGIAFESLMLMFLFITMLFSPDDSAPDPKESDESEMLIDEVGEISRDFAAASIQLENITDKLERMTQSNLRVAHAAENLVTKTEQAFRPNPEMIEIMRDTNSELNQFRQIVAELNKSMDEIRSDMISHEVRKYLEEIVKNNPNQSWRKAKDQNEE